MTHTRAFVDELKDAIAPRTVGLIVGVLVLQLAFIASYVGAFHEPQPRDLAVGVVAPAQVVDEVVAALSSNGAGALSAHRIASRADAVAGVQSGDLVAALVVSPTTTTDELLVASGGGPALVTVVEQAAQGLESARQRTVTVTDLVPLESGDARGLTGFYLAIGWIVGGYLVAALLGVARGARPANPHRAAVRLLALVPYSVAAGLGGALLVDQSFGALTGHFWALWGVGTLLVLAAATVTTGLQVLFGTVGIGLAVLLFVVLGNPSAGGAFPWPLLPGPWRAVGQWIPNGAGTESIRRIVYFGGTGVVAHVLVIAAWGILGVVVTMTAATRFHDRPDGDAVGPGAAQHADEPGAGDVDPSPLTAVATAT